MKNPKVKYVNCLGPGDATVMTISEMEKPTPQNHEVLIRVHYAGVNRPDLLQRQGAYPAPSGASPILGLELSGEIVAVGSESRYKIGDHVCALVPGGGYAEYCLAPSLHCLPIPNGVSMLEAAGLPETYFTVWANVFQIGRLKEGERFLVHGGSSGIGTTAIQLAKSFGAKVFATAGSDVKCKACHDLGAISINYHTQDFVSEIMRYTNSQGVDLILDMVGGEYAARNLDCLAVDGRLVQIAVQAGAQANLNLAKIMQKRILLTGSTLRPRSLAAKAKIAEELREHVWPLLEGKKIAVKVDKVFLFNDVISAHLYLEAGQNIGKVILQIS